MSVALSGISVAGETVQLPSACVADRRVVVYGRWAREAAILDDEWLSGDLVPDPAYFLQALGESGLVADWFTFAQKFTDTKAHHPYPWEWDNVAALPLSTYDEWWNRFVVHDLRKNVKRAKKRGVEVRVVAFDDALVRGIKAIYDETPIRQGRRFPHYGKPLEQVRRENETFAGSSAFIGAFLDGELIGFIKLVYVDDTASMMQIISLSRLHHLYVTNAMIATSVAVAVGRSCAYLVYGKYTYGNKSRGSVVRFKRDHGFEQIRFPRYYIPLSARGRLLLWAGAQHGLKHHIPECVTHGLLRVRARMLAPRQSSSEALSAASAPAAAEGLPCRE